jgi:succinyl-diaminopimelate desuccinylase
VPSGVFRGLTDAELGDRLAARTLELIDIPSESRDEDRIAGHVLGVLQDGGVPVRDAGDTCVLAGAPAATDGRPWLVLGGHFDTVPAQDNRPGHRTPDAVHGLGATDMLGALAVMIELGLALAGDDGATEQARARLGLLFFGREELPFHESALTPLLEREPGLHAADLVLMMEPTDNQIHAGCLGNLNATWTFHGRSGHSARPWLADSAVSHAAAGLTRLDEIGPIEHRFGGLVFTEVVSVTRISGGIADNVVPDRVDCHVNYRSPPGRAPEESEALLRSWCSGEHETLEIIAHAPSAPVVLPADNPLLARLVDVGGLDVLPKQAWTPVAEFGAHDIPAVNFGPGDPAYAHRRDELVTVDALVRCARTLDALLLGD